VTVTVEMRVRVCTRVRVDRWTTVRVVVTGGSATRTVTDAAAGVLVAVTVARGNALGRAVEPVERGAGVEPTPGAGAW
jgi:hypothetical protein